MAAIISNNFRALNAKGFIEDVRSELSNVYIGVGKATAWQDSAPSLSDFTDSAAATPADTIDDLNQARANMVGIKLLRDNDVSHVAPRHDWAAGEIYDPWDSNDTNIYEKPFYVLTNDFKVYKCIDRETLVSKTSDVPTKVQAAPFTTADGYTWKYMYTIIAADSEKFLTRSYMPVKTLTVSTSSLAGAVTTTYDASADRVVEMLHENPNIMVGQTVSASGLNDGTFATTTVVKAVSGRFVTMSSNTAQYITDDGTTFTFGDFEDTNPLYDQQQAQKDSIAIKGGIDRIEVTNVGTGITNTKTEIADQIHIVGDGLNAAVATSAGITQSANTVTRIVPTTPGTGYSVADVSVINDSLTGSGLAARAIIGPPSGHGADPVAELGGFYIGLNSQISGIDDVDIANNQDFRQITVLKNPTVGGAVQTEAIAAATSSNRGTFRTTKFVTYAADGSHDNDVATMAGFVANGNDVLIKGAAAINGVLPQAYVVNVDQTAGVRKIYYVQDSLTGYQAFAPTGDITYAHSGAPTGSQGPITLAASNGTTEFDKTSGEILFLENRDPIQRSSTQIEDIKLIIEF